MKLPVLALLLLSVISLTVIDDSLAARGVRSFRFRSYRSYRSSYRSYRSSYRSYRSSSFRKSSYRMAPAMLRRKGGFSGNKQALLAAGSLYIAYNMRPSFHYGGGGWGYHGSYKFDDYAVCENSFTGKDMYNRTTTFRYFLCPSDRWDLFQRYDVYCCGPRGSQRCCNEAEFYQQYGVLAGPSVTVIALCTVFGILLLCCCCGIACYCNFRRRRAQAAGARPVPTANPDSSKPMMADPTVAYPLHPVQPPPPPQNPGPDGGNNAYPLYPPAQQASEPYPAPGGVAPYPAPGGTAPYPGFDQQQQQQQYQPPPPPYPGPA